MAIKHFASIAVITTLFTSGTWAQDAVNCVNGITAPPVADRSVFLYGEYGDGALHLDGKEGQRVKFSLRGVGKGDERPNRLLYVGQDVGDVYILSSITPTFEWGSYDLNVSPGFEKAGSVYLGYSTMQMRYAVGGHLEAPKPKDFLDGSQKPFDSDKAKFLLGLQVSGGGAEVRIGQRSIPNGPPTNADGTMVFCRATGFSCGVNVPKTDENGTGFRVRLIGVPNDGQGTLSSCSATNYYLVPPGSIAVMGRPVTGEFLAHPQF